MSSNKREIWDVEETRYFLSLIRERQVLKCLDGKRFRTQDIFSHLEKPMHNRGYVKSAKQMQTRFKTLRFKFYQMKRELKARGEESAPKRFYFYDQMNVLLTHQPVGTLEEGADSACSSESHVNDNANDNTTLYEDDKVVEQIKIEVTQSNNNTNSTEDEEQNTSTQWQPVDEVEESQMPPVKKKKHNSFQQSLYNFAEANKQNVFDAQNHLVEQQQKFLKMLLEKQKNHEAQLTEMFLEKQKEMLSETTTAFLTGLKTILQALPPPPPTYVHGYAAPMQFFPNTSTHVPSSSTHVPGCLCTECLKK